MPEETVYLFSAIVCRIRGKMLMVWLSDPDAVTCACGNIAVLALPIQRIRDVDTEPLVLMAFQLFPNKSVVNRANARFFRL